MKIKLAMVDNDSMYLDRIVNIFNTKYADKLEVCSFTNFETAMVSIDSMRIDVLLVSDIFDIDVKMIPDRCAVAYIVDSPDISELKGLNAISKFQKIEFIYKQILNIYADKANEFSTRKRTDGDVKIIGFTSFNGGVGKSTMAAAFAKKAAISNKVLFLTLETLGDASLFFRGEGQFTFSDLIYAMKSKKTNFAIKFESSVKKSTDGVDFFTAPRVALDNMELSSAETMEMLQTIIDNCNYDYIVLDFDFEFDELTKSIWNISDEVVFISDGSETANLKFERGLNALKILNSKNEADYRLDKINIMYNMFSNKCSKKMEGIDAVELGGLPRFEHATLEQVLEQVRTITCWDRFM